MRLSLVVLQDYRAQEPQSISRDALLLLSTSILASQGCTEHLQTVTQTVLRGSHATETCELDSSACKLSRALMLLETEPVCSVPNHPSTAGVW